MNKHQQQPWRSEPKYQSQLPRYCGTHWTAETIEALIAMMNSQALVGLRKFEEGKQHGI